MDQMLLLALIVLLIGSMNGVLTLTVLVQVCKIRRKLSGEKHDDG